MVNVNLKDSKMGYNPHSNPRDVGKSPKVVVRLKKLGTPHFPKNIIQRNFGITGKIEKFSIKTELFNSNISGLKHILYYPGNDASCFLGGMQLVNDTK